MESKISATQFIEKDNLFQISKKFIENISNEIQKLNKKIDEIKNMVSERIAFKNLTLYNELERLFFKIVESNKRNVF